MSGWFETFGKGCISAMLVVAFSLAAAGALGQERSRTEAVEEASGQGFMVTLSVYSGRPNPQWWIPEEEPAFAQLAEAIAALKPRTERLFEYEEWNRLGYASFRVFPKNIQGFPYSIHVWRDMAYIVHEKDGGPTYALGATKVYDLLVAQAEERGHKEFFVNYRKLRGAR